MDSRGRQQTGIFTVSDSTQFRQRDPSSQVRLSACCNRGRSGIRYLCPTAYIDLGVGFPGPRLVDPGRSPGAAPVGGSGSPSLGLVVWCSASNIFEAIVIEGDEDEGARSRS